MSVNFDEFLEGREVRLATIIRRIQECCRFYLPLRDMGNCVNFTNRSRCQRIFLMNYLRVGCLSIAKTFDLDAYLHHDPDLGIFKGLRVIVIARL